MTTKTTTPHPPGATLHLGGEAWAHPSLADRLVPIDTLTPYPGNPRRGDQDAITASLRDLGLYRAVIGQTSTRHVLAGNHTRRGLLDLGATMVPVDWVDLDDTRAAALVARDNRTSDLGTYDTGDLEALLTTLTDADALALSGYGADDLAALADHTDDDEQDGEADNRAPTTGEQLAIADVTWGEPHHRVHHGDVWSLGRHTLVVARLHTEHQAWVPLLTPEHLFAPYPEPYLTAGEQALERPLLLVQPNLYLAGHLLDKHAAMFPDDQVVKISEAGA